MKRIYLLSIALVAISCGNDKSAEKETVNLERQTADPVAAGKELFDGVGNCFACHNPDQKIIGPSIKEIAAIYRDSRADMVAFLKGEGKPIVDPSQYEVMKANFAITKNMSDDELKSLEAYILSHK